VERLGLRSEDGVERGPLVEVRVEDLAIEHDGTGRAAGVHQAGEGEVSNLKS
jgi:predicted RNA-binding protein with TRAM domain